MGSLYGSYCEWPRFLCRWGEDIGLVSLVLMAVNPPTKRDRYFRNRSD